MLLLERDIKDSNNSSAFFKAFPDWHSNVEQIVAEGNLVVIFLNGTGTHQENFKECQRRTEQ